MKAITYLKGDATQPQGSDNKIIVHICNDIGGWGKGFVLALSKRWKAPEKAYRAWFASGEGFELGAIQLVQVEDDLWVANLIGQHRIKRKAVSNILPPIRYEAVEKGLGQVAIEAQALGASIHMPRIGCGLAGGKWELMEPIMQRELSEKGISVTVYDFG